ncbi:MAG: zf-HC2 domain-containing protein [Lysobacterales bacterium]
MTACTRWQPLLSDAAHGETSTSAEQQAKFQAHLSDCSGCQQELDAQTAFLSSLTLPDRPAAGELDAWRQVGPQVYPAPRQRFVLGFPLAASLGLAILITGIGIGRLMIAQPAVTGVPSPTLAASSVAEPQLNESTQARDGYVDFLESAAPLLLAITNRNNPALISARSDAPAGGFREPEAAAALANDANALAFNLESQQRDREAALVRELELVFLQIANLPNPSNESGLRLLQAAIEDRALLFQLSVEELRYLPNSRPPGA